MKTLQEILNLIEDLNEEAHRLAWDSWVAADELMESGDEDDWEIAEDLRHDASMEQASYFRDLYYELAESDKEAIVHWLKEDQDLKDEFSVWFGEEEFEHEFDSD